MVNDKWVIRWNEYLSDTYVYGAYIHFLEDGSVEYKNPMIAPGTVIHAWKSRTDFSSQRIEPSLPLIDGEAPYSFSFKFKSTPIDNMGIIFCVKYYDRFDMVVDSYTSRELDFCVKPPIQTYSYSVELINGGDANFIFDYFVLKEISREEYDAEQDRIKEDKENIKKGKKARRNSKKVKR